jgi:hypothetical protein
VPHAGTTNDTSGSVTYAAAVGLAGAAEASKSDAANLKLKPSRPKMSDPLVWIDLEMTGATEQNHSSHTLQLTAMA